MTERAVGGDRAAGGVVLGLHMIVRDEERVIGRCLDAILPGVDRVMIVDTGSTDGTPGEVDYAYQRAELDESRASMKRMEWPGDFGAARQRSLDLLLERWPEVTHVVWCDADDIVVGAEHLRAWAETIQPGSPGMLAHYAYGFGPSGELTVSHYRERILTRDAITGWSGAIHENLLAQPGPWGQLPVPPASQMKAPWPRDPAGVEWVHAPTAGKQSLGRNRAILEADLERETASGRPTIRTLGYLAQEYEIAAAVTDDEDAREEWLGKARDMYALADETAGHVGRDEHSYQLRHRWADLERRAGRLRNAQHLDEANVKQLPRWPDAWIGLARTHLELGEHELAITYVDAGLSKPYPQTGLILNPTDYTVEPRVVRAQALRGMGNAEAAQGEIQRALAQSPNDPTLQSIATQIGDEVNRERTLHALLSLDEALARHDENLRALSVLEAAPHFLQAHPEVVQRRVRRRLGLNHLTNARAYNKWYREGAGGDAPFQAQPGKTYQETVVWAAESLARTQFMLAGLREEHGDDLSAVHLLDVGCNDGWMGQWLVAEHGLGRYTGLDLSTVALDRAREVTDREYPEVADRLEFITGSVFHVPMPRRVLAQRFNAVACFEMIEHVHHPEGLLARLERVAPDATRVFISTPNGSYEGGHIADWNAATPRGHVRAMRPAELTRLALDRGVLEGFTTGADRTMCVAYQPKRRRGTVDFYLGAAGQTWQPTDVLTKGLGGSETMAIRYASRLADMGWRVRVFGAVPHEQATHGVEYLPYYHHDPTEQVDALIVSRAPGYLRGVGGRHVVNAGHVALWLHDAAYPDLDAAQDYDNVWCVGAWQARKLFGDDWATLPPPFPPVAILPNGLGMHDYTEPLGFEDRAPRVVYSSSPDRGLELLLDMWPTVHERCATAGVDAELVIAYGFTPTYDLAAQSNPDLQRLRVHVEACGASMPGVRLTGAIGQPELHRLQQDSRVWAYPTGFPEVSCITAMEAQAAGMAVLATSTAELASTIRGDGKMWPPADQWTDRDREEFIDALVAALTDPAEWWRLRRIDALLAREIFDADHGATVLDDHLDANVLPAVGRWETANDHEPESGDDPA